MGVWRLKSALFQQRCATVWFSSLRLLCEGNARVLSNLEKSCGPISGFLGWCGFFYLCSVIIFCKTALNCFVARDVYLLFRSFVFENFVSEKFYVLVFLCYINSWKMANSILWFKVLWLHTFRNIAFPKFNIFIIIIWIYSYFLIPRFVLGIMEYLNCFTKSQSFGIQKRSDFILMFVHFAVNSISLDSLSVKLDA